mmetsp:Transcript_21582/g.56291  ORF Transcript_21582/g.56291 Transcript_21582/m.56291 type:complete len:291 (-) Transcript_21582:395-1267(-)
MSEHSRPWAAPARKMAPGVVAAVAAKWRLRRWRAKRMRLSRARGKRQAQQQPLAQGNKGALPPDSPLSLSEHASPWWRTRTVMRVRLPRPSSSNSSSSSSSTGRVVRKPTMAAGASTTTKRALPRIMQALGIRHGIGRPTTDGLVSVDIALRPGPDRFLALQVVEEHEHTANTGQFLGPQRFQSSVLEANGWEVKHVMAKDLRMLDEAAWPAFIAELLRNMGVRVSPDALAAAQARLAQGTRGAISKSVGVGGRYSSSSGSRGLDMLMENGPRERRAVSKRGQQQRGPRR